MQPAIKIAILIALVIIACDQVSKEWILGTVPEGMSIEVTSYFNLVRVWNRGVSFGMLAHHSDLTRWGLSLLAIIITAALFVWLKREPERLKSYAIGSIAGGAIGNVIDRIRFGAVYDFLDFHIAGYHWPAFNVADSCIFIGVGIIFFSEFKAKKTHEHS